MQTLVLGIGNLWRGDDAAGLLAVQALRTRALPGVTVIESSVVEPTLIESWQGVDRLIVIDAAVSGAAPGAVHSFNLSQAAPPCTLSFRTTHTFDLMALIELARLLGRLPPQVWILGVEGGDFALGQPVSTAVSAGVAVCVAMVADLLGDKAEPQDEPTTD